MAQRLIGKVTTEERDKIQNLIERRNALRSLSLTIADAGFPTDNHLYEKMINDMSNTLSQISSWWDENGKKYQWEGTASDWRILFYSCEVFLVEK